MPSRKAKRSSRQTRRSKSISIESEKDMHKLEKALKRMPMVLVLVHADWCGPCQRYKKEVWSKLEASPKKNVGLVKLNEKVFPSSPLKDSKISGYPSILLIGKDGKPAEFKDESTGEPTNAMPNASDLTMMQGVLKGNSPLNASSATPEASEASSEASEASSAEDKNSSAILLDSESPVSVLPPDASSDLLDSQNMSEISGAPAISSPATPATPPGTDSSQLGGSLYMSLLDAAKLTAPAALLTAAAVARGSRKLSRRR
jgi:thiol-disulfide isomerase/thioredoxin